MICVCVLSVISYQPLGVESYPISVKNSYRASLPDMLQVVLHGLCNTFFYVKKQGIKKIGKFHFSFLNSIFLPVCSNTYD